VLNFFDFHRDEEASSPQKLKLLVIKKPLGQVLVYQRLCQIVSLSAEADFRAYSLDPVKQERTVSGVEEVFLDCLEAVCVDLVVLLVVEKSGAQLHQLSAF
jgi:hypothetical protein